MVLLLTLRGTPTLYNGDELGLENVPIPPERARDPFGIAQPGTDQGRDPVRTPMPWDRTAHCGFTTGDPWLPLGHDHALRSVEVQQRDPSSMLTLTRALLDLRHREPALALGSWAPVTVEGDVLAYARALGERRAVVVLNLEAIPKVVRFAEPCDGRIELSTHHGRAGERIGPQIELGADEAVIIATFSASG
jgi:alpha-glucosidase